MLKPNLREHPLFKNRHRVLAAPSGTPLTGRKELVGAATLGLIFIFFGAGYWITHPGAIEDAMRSFGTFWSDWSQSVYGSNLGSGLAGKTPWILARAGGIMAYLSLSVAMVLGLMTSLGWRRGLGIMYLHRLVVLLGLVFLTTHLAGLAFDNYTPISIAQSLLPFASPYRPLWTALGTFTLYGMLLVGISAYLASKLGYKVWRTLHYLGFGLFWLALLHGLFAGTDSSFVWMRSVYFVSGLLILSLTGLRILKRRPRKVRASDKPIVA